MNTIKNIIQVLILFIVLIMIMTSCNTDKSVDPVDGSVPIGVTLALTGGSPLDIDATEYFVELAVKDVNQYFTDNSIALQVKADIHDTENSPVGMIAAMEYFSKNNIKYVASASISQNILDSESAIKSFGGVMINSSSTAVMLAKSDNIFRIIPNDIVTAAEITKMLVTDGIKKLIILYRDDIWGLNLKDYLKDQVEAGGNEVHSIEYDARFLPESLNNAISNAETQYQALSAQSPTQEIAMVVFAFNEIADILTLAQKTEILLAINWYGGDGFVTNDLLVNNAQTASIASRVNLYCPAIAEPVDAAYQDIKSKIIAELSYTPRTNNYLIYDAFWAASLARLKNLSDPIESAKQALSEDVYICGDIELDANGDRKESDYECWHIVEEAGTYSWTKRN